MIQIKKGEPPAVLLDKGAKFQKEAVLYQETKKCDGEFKSNFKKHASEEEGVLNGFTSKLFTLYSFYSDRAVKRQLIEEHSGKCAFCESFIMDTDVGDVEHYRPKTEVTEVDPNNTEQERLVSGHPGYFWLSQTWENLFLSCKQCNQAYKRTRFDVVASDAAATLDKKLGDFPRLKVGKEPDPKLEVPMLLYPGSGDVDVDPREVIRFNPATAEAFPIGGGNDSTLNLARAHRTIELVGLNRPRLLEARASHLLHLRGLFILAATQGYVDMPKDQYSIFDFKYAKDCAGKDAQVALRSAGSKKSEFSALAQDAISEWSKELKLGKSDAKIPQKDEIQLNVNIDWELLRLDKQIQLLDACREASASILDREAEPDTHDLDLDYNEALADYKQIVERVGKDKKKIETAHQEVQEITEENAKLSQEVHDLEAILSDVEIELKKLTREDDAARSWSAAALQAEEISTLDLDTQKAQIALSKYKDLIIDNELVTKAVKRTTFQQESEKTLDENQKRRIKLEEEKQETKEKLKVPEKDYDRVLKRKAGTEAIYTTYYFQLVDLKSEVVDLQTGYENCGGKVNDRTARTKKLADAIDNLADWLDAEEDLNEDVANHLKKKKWPPKITGI